MPNRFYLYRLLRSETPRTYAMRFLRENLLKQLQLLFQYVQPAVAHHLDNWHRHLPCLSSPIKVPSSIFRLISSCFSIFFFFMIFPSNTTAFPMLHPLISLKLLDLPFPFMCTTSYWFLQELLKLWIFRKSV
jgi:hypothetical protein